MTAIDPIQQREFAVQVVRALREKSYEAYWAGGCVRDQWLGRTPKDYDVATSARPEEVRAVFGTKRTLAVGAAFGVIVVLGPPGAGQIDVATFREDVGYSDGRRPDSVRYSTAEADALRRDFTINGLFFDPLTDRLLDFVAGVEDLARGVVRAIGNAHDRFSEDKLRMLRAVRFAATFQFFINIPTRQAIEALAGEINSVSAERIAAEMRLMLVDSQRTTAMTHLEDVGLLQAVLPELGAARDDSERWPKALATLSRLVDPSFPLALAALLCEFIDAKASEAACRRWKLSNQETHRVVWLVRSRDALAEAERQPWPRLQRVLTAPGTDELLPLTAARGGASSEADLDFCRRMLALPADELDPPALVSGDDLIAHGVPRGPAYQRLLEAVRDAQLEKRIATRAEALQLIDQLSQEEK